jgi:hypothetical protein
MKVVMDEDVKRVAEFMQENVPADRLAAVARGVGQLAPILWGHYYNSEIFPLSLRGDEISICAPSVPRKR